MSTLEKIYNAIPVKNGKRVVEFRNGVVVTEDYSSRELLCLIYLMRGEMENLSKIKDQL